MRLPKYRRHSARDFAFVEVGGHRRRLPGRYNSAESREAYGQLLQRLLAPAADLEPQLPVGPATVADLVDAWLDWAKGYYPDAKEYKHCGAAAAAALEEHAGTLLSSFGPRILKQVRTAMVARGWSRPYVNRQVKRLRRMFRWGVEHEFCSPVILEGLRAVAPLREGRTSAPEPTPVTPVDPAMVAAVLPHCSPVVAAMIQLQELTGMRSKNLCHLTPGQIDQDGDVWWYRPRKHKSSWRGKSLGVPLGPRAQALLKPYLDRDPGTPCFSPLESEAWRLATMRSARKTKVQPSQENRAKPRRQRPRRDHYTTTSYYRAVQYACERAFDMPHELRRIPKTIRVGGKVVPLSDEERARRQRLATAWRQEHCWHPHQLRHSVATAVRKRYGLEAAQVYLGHATADVTQVYAERDLGRATEIAREIG